MVDVGKSPQCKSSRHSAGCTDLCTPPGQLVNLGSSEGIHQDPQGKEASEQMVEKPAAIHSSPSSVTKSTGTCPETTRKRKQQRFVQKSELNDHLRLNHPHKVREIEYKKAQEEAKPHMCTNCNRGFNSKFSMHRHMKSFCLLMGKKEQNTA
ncbi:hypothetical protein ACOMHN_011202 [Nucella lapillus]